MGNLDRSSHRLYSVRSGLLLITVVVLAAACGADAGISDVTDSSTTIVIGQLGFIEGTVTAGPQCPVQRVPPDPACQDRPVAGATILITERGSGTVARLVTDELGRFSAALAPGFYVIEPQPLEGLLGTPGPTEVTVESQNSAVVEFLYDTGIR